MKCSDFDSLLMDGEPFAMETARRHALECASCAKSLALWNEISSTAQTMRTTWKSDTLWPRIERSLGRENQRSRSALWQVAAALALLIGLTGIVWKTYQINRDADRYILRQAALDEVNNAERQHIEAIKHLEKIAGDKLADPETPLMVSYKEKLMLLDDAIAECQTAIDQNRNNTHLRKQLLAIYSEKQRTLQDVLREDNTNASRQ